MSTTGSPLRGLVGPPASKTEYALARLRQEIADGVIRPGESLRQADLAKRFGVSPTPVREALRLLEAEGTISYSPHRGATVAELTDERIRDLYLLRASTEAIATQLAAERRTDEQLEEIQEMHARLTEASRAEVTSHEQLGAWNRELHLLICSAGSALITSHVMTLWRMIPTRMTMWRDREMVGCFVDQHAGIVEAIGRGDGQEANARMTEHIMTAAASRLHLDQLAEVR